MPSSEVLNIQVTKIDNGYLVLRHSEHVVGTVYVTTWQRVVDEIQETVLKSTPNEERRLARPTEIEFRKGGAVQTDIEDFTK